MGARQTILDPSQNSPEVREFEKALRRQVVGQDRAVRRLARVYQVFRAGLSTPGRPVVNLLFLGPTGSGKTRLVEATAEALFDNPRAFIKVDCAEFQHSHEIAKLIGSPPGYLGHRETQPLITQEALDQHQTDKIKLSLVLFDEIEKASDALWQLLLGILDKGTLTLGDNRRVDFSHTMIFLTSNLGSHEVMNLMEKILDIELERVQQRIINASDGRQFVFHCTKEARDFLLREGTDMKFGARHLKRSIERHLVFPISNLLATDQIALGDLITVDFDANLSKLIFVKEDQGAIVQKEEEVLHETALVPVSVRIAGASRALAKRASREAFR
jgi:ATP-dependent Clp protease ATP-binding subunit ClpA